MPIDSWEDAADTTSPSPTQETTTPDDEEEDTSESDNIKKKKKVIVEEEELKKEPINVIFIGHVGKSNPTCITVYTISKTGYYRVIMSITDHSRWSILTRVHRGAR